MKNIIKLDLRKFNHDKLKNVSDLYDLDYETLVENKNSGYAILWIDLVSSMIVAFTTKKQKTLVYTKAMNEFLCNLKDVETSSSNTSELFFDKILDKVVNFGVDSLNDEEKIFLDGL
jgi:hypothetical protein